MRSIRPLYLSAILAAALLMTACSGPMVQTRYDHTVRFSDLHTYSWEPNTKRVSSGLPNEPELDTRIQAAIDSEMTSKGFQVTSNTQADLVLDYQVTAEQKSDATHLQDEARANFMGMTHTLGTLRLVMTRPTSATPAWQGAVYANIDTTRPAEERERRLKEAVHGLLAKFPPK